MACYSLPRLLPRLLAIAFLSVGSAASAHASICSVHTGYTLTLCDKFTSLDPARWVVQQASTPAAINLSLNNSGNPYGEVESYLPNQYKVVHHGGVQLQATNQSLSAIGGNGNKQCANPIVSYCSFPWTSSEINGRGGIVVQPGYVEWKATLRSSTNNGTWPALWLFSNDSARYAEIDMAESFSNDPAHVYMHLHYGNPGSHGNDNSISFCPMADPNGNDWQDAHTFAVDWNPVAGTLTGYIDGTACGTVTSGEKPNESGSSPVWIPNVPLYPIANLAVSPGASGGPYLMGVQTFAMWTNDSVPAEPVPSYVGNITFDQPSYEGDDTAVVGFTIHAGSTAIPAGNIQVSLMDFLGDQPNFHQGSTVNANFPPGQYYYPYVPAIPAGSSWTGSVNVWIPSGTPEGVYSLVFDQTAVGYAHLLVGNPLPPVP
jgi:hypothetical protein